MGLINAKHIAIQSRVVWVPKFQVRTLQVWVLYVLPKPFIPQKETGSLGFPPICKTLCQGWGLWTDSILTFPTYFPVGVFSVI